MPENDETTLTEKPDKPPISEAKLQANRRNGRLGRGPTTEAGKRRSSLNATRSGLHGQIICATAEEPQSSRNIPPTYAPNSRPSAPRKAFLLPQYQTTCSELTGFARLRQGYSPADFEPTSTPSMPAIPKWTLR